MLPNRPITQELLTSTKAAQLLGVSSPNTVKNWLEAGYFPGAFRTAGGHWRFPLSEVLAMKQAMEDREQRNAKGDLTPNDVDDDAEAPVL